MDVIPAEPVGPCLACMVDLLSDPSPEAGKPVRLPSHFGGGYLNLSIEYGPDGQPVRMVMEATRRMQVDIKNFQIRPPFEALVELLEDHTRKEWMWVEPREIGVATDAPLLAVNVMRANSEELRGYPDASVFGLAKHQVGNLIEKLGQGCTVNWTAVPLKPFTSRRYDLFDLKAEGVLVDPLTPEPPSTFAIENGRFVARIDAKTKEVFPEFKEQVAVDRIQNWLWSTGQAVDIPSEPVSATPERNRTGQEEVLRYQWMRNKEGGQKWGNQEEIRPLTEELYEKHYRHLTRGRIPYVEHAKTYPGCTHCKLVRISGQGEWQPTVRSVGTREELEADGAKARALWAIQVHTFDSKEAAAHGGLADSEQNLQRGMDKGGKR